MSKTEYRPDDFDDISCEDHYLDNGRYEDDDILDGWEDDEEDMQREAMREEDEIADREYFGYADDDTPF